MDSRSMDNFQVLNENDRSLSLTTSQMSQIRQSIDGFQIGRVHLCVGKVVCVDKKSQHGPFYEYGIGCLIGGNKVLIPANILFSQRTKKVYEQIYFYPDEYLEKGFDLQSQKRIRISNVYINPQYFRQMNENKKIISVFDVAICELNSQDIKKLKFKQSSIDIAFRFDYIFQSQEKHQILLCKYSQHDQKNRHLLQLTKSQITTTTQDKRMISYKYMTQEEQRNLKNEDALILYKVWQQQNWKYQIIGIHKGSQGDKSYGFLLSEFFYYQDEISYHLKEHKQIDFNQLMKKSFNDLLKITIDLKQITDLQYDSLDDYIKQKQNYQRENQKLIKQKQNYQYENQKLKNINENLKQSQLSSIQKVQHLQSRNKQIEKLYLQQKQKYEVLKNQNNAYLNQKQTQIIDLQMTIENLNAQIQKRRNYPTNQNYQKSSQIKNESIEIDKLKEQLKTMNRKFLILDYEHQNLKKKFEQLSQKQILSQKIINQMNEQIYSLTHRLQNAQNINGLKSPQKRKVGILRNQKKTSQKQITKPQGEEDNTRMIGQLENQNQKQQQIKRDKSIILSGQYVVQTQKIDSITSLIVQCGSFVESQQINSASLMKKASINKETIVSNLDNLSTIHQNRNEIQQGPNVSIENADEDNLILNKHNVGIFKNIYLAMSQMTGVLTELDRKIIQIKQLYQQKIRDLYQLDHPLKFLKKVYNDKKKQKQNYFINSKKRVQNAYRQHQVKLTEKGFSLYLEKVQFDFDQFFKYDWLNLQFLKIQACQIDSQGWEKFTSKAHLFLPNLKVLRIELNHKIEIKQKNLLNLWSIQRIWFERQQTSPEHTVLSKNQVKNFVQNKMKNESKAVKVQFRQI